MGKSDLSERHAAEEEFHDRKLKNEKKQKYYGQGFNRPILLRMMSKMGDIEGKNVLEFGCGQGWFTKTLADKGAEVWAFDISNEAIDITKTLMERHNLKEKVHLDQMAAENLQYDSDKFDVVVGLAILHHLDIDQTCQEIMRVLKPGGKAYFMEPLGHNPLLNLYRKLTPHLRSKDETPLLFEQYVLMENNFSGFKHEEYYFLSFFALIWHFLSLNKLMLPTRNFLMKIDKIILNVFPRMRKYCWYSILEFKK